VVVTARRLERLLDVPLAAAVTRGEEMRARDLNTTEDLALSVPALTLQADASAKDRTIRIRRIGTATSASQEVRLASGGCSVRSCGRPIFLRTNTDETYRLEVAALLLDGSTRERGWAGAVRRRLGEASLPADPALTLNAGRRAARDVAGYEHARRSSWLANAPGIRAGHASAGRISAPNASRRARVRWGLRLLMHFLSQDYSTYVRGTGFVRMVPRRAPRRAVLMLVQSFYAAGLASSTARRSMPTDNSAVRCAASATRSTSLSLPLERAA